MFDFMKSKTYQSAAIMAGLTFLKFAGIINDDAYQSLLALAIAYGFVGVKSAIKKAEK